MIGSAHTDPFGESAEELAACKQVGGREEMQHTLYTYTRCHSQWKGSDVKDCRLLRNANFRKGWSRRCWWRSCGWLPCCCYALLRCSMRLLGYLGGFFPGQAERVPKTLYCAVYRYNSGHSANQRLWDFSTGWKSQWYSTAFLKPHDLRYHYVCVGQDYWPKFNTIFNSKMSYK